MDETVFQQRRITAARAAVAALAAIVLMGSLTAHLWWGGDAGGDTGSYLIPQGTMSDEEARAMLDRQAELSRITVSIRPVQELVDDQLHMNFVVPAGNNNFSERLEIEQDGRIVYRSGIVEPEHVIEWGDVAGAHAGAATATIYAVDADGFDFGNPVSVEIEISEG